jgi:acetoin utilization protein AcuB
MIIKQRMVTDAITLSPDDSFKKAINIVQDKGIRHLPVVADDGRVVGIVTDRDLAKASPSGATSLSVYELNYLLSSITIKDLMTEKPITVEADQPIEEAARLIHEHNIGALPVTEGGQFVGLITKSDILGTFVEILGLGVPSVRLELDLENRAGALMETLKLIRDHGGYIVSVIVFQEEPAGIRKSVIRVRVDDEAALREALEKSGPPIIKVCDVCRLG